MPLVSLLESNIDRSPATVVLWPAVVVIAVAISWWLLMTVFARDRLWAALLVTMFMFVSLSYAWIVQLAVSLGVPALVPLLYVGCVGAGTVLIQVRRPATEPTRFANVAFALLLTFVSLPIVMKEWSRIRSGISFSHIEEGRPTDRPDVWILTLDGYGRHDVVQDIYGFNNPLEAELRSLGFVVPDAAAANYMQTPLALASALNLDYVSALMDMSDPRIRNRRLLADLIARNRFFSSFERAGYSISVYSSEYAMVRPGPVSERLGSWVSMDGYAYSAYESTIVPRLFQVFGLSRSGLPLRVHRHHLNWTFNDLSKRAERVAGGPVLVFAHLLAPHPPFAFDKNGEPKRTQVPALFHDGDAWHRIAQGSGENYEEGYLNKLRFLQPWISAFVRAVLERKDRRAIILIHADHGPRSRLTWNDLEATDLDETFGILVAIRFPNGERASISNGVTPINMFRSVLNRALGTNLSSLEDRSYFATWNDPFQHMDVSDRLRLSNGRLPVSRTGSPGR